MEAALLLPAEVRQVDALLRDAASDHALDKTALRISILSFPAPSYAPLYCLSALLSCIPGPWPVFELQQIYNMAWKVLPETAKSAHATPEARQLLDHVLLQCKASYASLADLYHSDSMEAAIIDPESERSITHNHLSAFIREFRLPLNVGPGLHKPVVAISLPNGPLLALAVLATATYYTAAPNAHGSGVGAEQFKADILQSRSNMVLASANDVDRLKLRDAWLNDAGIKVLLVELSDDLRLMVRDLDGFTVLIGSESVPPAPNRADDTAIMLFTSGTSGTKKLVPLSIHSMVCGIAMVIDSWGLSSSMRCVNQMPLNHVGGLIRNLFASICSGGSVICCSAFDANLFWDCVNDFAPTWYYASPSMHQCILEAGRDRPESLQNSQIRLVCNAAGGLLPTLACQLRDTFSTETVACTVLPSYGMTECMPMSTPPLSYRLEKTGTSGVSVGPEIAIFKALQRTRTGSVGHICVRGAPLFSGYLKDDNTVDTSCFTEDGWFDTGDMGYLDVEGFLYITGRSKEVVNRGGELISPFEVEEAVMAAGSTPGSPIHGRISKALVFSVAHDVLQEVVGLAVVSPDGTPRTCLRDIQEALKPVLSQVKVPVLLVFMDGGLPTNNNKVLRIRLATRLGLPEISDAISQPERHYTAICPPPNAPLSRSIECEVLNANHDSLTAACEKILPAMDTFIHMDPSDLYPELFLAPKTANPGTPAYTGFHQLTIIDQLAPMLHGYNRPLKVHQLESPFHRHADGTIDDRFLSGTLATACVDKPNEDMSATETTIAVIFSQLLSVPLGNISKSSDFFDLGGSSMSAGHLLSKLRKEFQLRVSIDVVFTNRQIADLAEVIDERMSANIPTDTKEPVTTIAQPELLLGCEETFSSTRPSLLLLQLLPLGLFYPMKRALTWTIFIYFLTVTQSWYTNNSVPGRLLDLVISMAVARAVTWTIAPLMAIACKWLLITHVEGLYPMWSTYHTRWWLCQKIISIAGLGIFGTCNLSRIWYYRLMGTTIGRRVYINKGATLGEYDLITIGDGAVLERCIVRSFAAERNTSMYLGRITIGANALVGLGSIVAAGTHIAENACIGPLSSSWEAADAADEANRDLASSRISGPHWLLSIVACLPIQIITTFIGAIPWLGGLVALVSHEPQDNAVDMLQEVIIWLASPSRVSFHYLALCLHAVLGPAFVFLAVYAVKRVLDLAIGPVRPQAAPSQSQLEKLRGQLLRTLMPAPQFHKLADLFGTHYEGTSVLARMMGARVGKHVYWPGTGPSIQDFPLLDIGDDVVFGSRAHLVTSDGMGSDYVRIQKGAMVADRVVLLPGVVLGPQAVFGSGALSRRNAHYAAGTTWVGSRENHAVCLSAQAQLKEYGLGSQTSQYYNMSTSLDNMPLPKSALSEAPAQALSLASKSPAQLSSAIAAHRPALTAEKVDRGNSTKASISPAATAPSASVGGTSGATPPQNVEGLPDPGKYGSSINVRTLASEASSITLVEKGNGFSFSTDTPKSHGDPAKSISITVRSSDTEFDASSTHSGSTSPFGRAFYHGLAPYRVWGQLTIFCYSTLIIIICALFWDIGSISAVQIVSHAFSHHTLLSTHFLSNTWYRPISLYVYFTALTVAIMAAQTIVVLLLLVGMKWLLLGRRTQGNYDWDKSPYCQRWQLFLKLESLRHHCYGGQGILGLLTGTAWIVAYFRCHGLQAGKDCALFAGGLPSLYFTEPDLLTLGDRVSVDDASLVGHINTRGKFDLNPLYVGDRSVLRSGSRLLSGAVLQADTCLLEHTLVMSGDEIPAACTSQGWPAEDFKGSRMPTLKVKQVWKKA